MLFSNVKLKYKLNIKLQHLLLEFLLKLVLRRRKRSDCGVSSETLGIYRILTMYKLLVEAYPFLYIAYKYQYLSSTQVVYETSFNFLKTSKLN